MTSRKRKVLKTVAVITALLVLVVWSAKIALFDWAPSIPDVSETEFDLDQIRTLALSGDGELPVRLNILEVTEAPFLRNVVFAGGGFGEHTLYFSSLQLVFPARTIIVDAVHSESVHDQEFGAAPFDRVAYETVQDALLESDLILATHEHIDHVGGIAASPQLDTIKDKVVLTREQLESLESDEQGLLVFPNGLSGLFEPLDYSQYHVVAPGLVLIKSPGHTPGSQMIYVRLEDGNEWLLVGDIAWHMDNISLLHGRSWIAHLLGNQDRTALAHQLRLLHDLDESREVHLLVAHDKEQHADYIRQGLLGSGFE